MRTRHHFESHRREALTNRRRFQVLNALLVTGLVVASGLYLRDRYFTHAATANLTITVHGASSATVYAYDRTGAYRGVGNCNATTGNPPFKVYGSITCSGTQIGLPNSDANYPYTLAATPISGYSGPTYAQTEGNCDASGCIVYITGGSSESMDLYYSQTPPPPAVSVSASPANVTVNQAFTISWSSSNSPTSCSGSGTNFSGAKAASGSQVISESNPGTFSFVVTCSNAGGSGSGSASVTVKLPPPPSAPNLTVASTTSTSVNLAWTASNAGSGASISGYRVVKDGAVVATVGTTSYTSGSLACGQAHSYYVTAVDNFSQATSSNTVSATPPCPSGGSGGSGSGGGSGGGSSGGSTGGSGSGGGPTGSSGTGSSGGSGGSGGSPMAQSIAPGVPTGFSATVGKDAVVQLRWDITPTAATYALDRSADGTNWKSIVSGYQDTSFSDDSALFNTKYYYRLQAVNLAGASGYAQTNITTTPFSSNVSTNSASTITSEDSVVTAQIPAGTLGADASCSIDRQHNNSETLPLGKLSLVAGPYELVCKTADGTIVQMFSQAIKLSVSLTKNQVDTYQHFAAEVYSESSNSWGSSPSTYDAVAKTVTLSATQSLEFAILAQQKPSYINLITVLVLLLLAGGGFYLLRLRRSQKAQYDDYIRRKYYNF